LKIKGHDCREAKHLGWREADSKRDKNLRGEPMHDGYVAIVRIKDCRLYEEDGRDFYDSKDAPAIPINHGATSYGYGKASERKGKRWVYDGKYGDKRKWVLVSRYKTTPFYAVRDAIVYQGTIHNPIRDNDGSPMFVEDTWYEGDEKSQNGQEM